MNRRRFNEDQEKRKGKNSEEKEINNHWGKQFNVTEYGINACRVLS